MAYHQVTSVGKISGYIIVSDEAINLDNIQQHLIYECMSGHIEKIKKILEDTRIKINEHDMYGRKPLIEASYAGQLDVVKLLVAIPGTNINIKDKLGKTPLLASLKQKHRDISRFLLSLPHIQVDTHSANIISDMI